VAEAGGFLNTALTGEEQCKAMTVLSLLEPGFETSRLSLTACGAFASCRTAQRQCRSQCLEGRSSCACMHQ
jgi:hypothetical protein